MRAMLPTLLVLPFLLALAPPATATHCLTSSTINDDGTHSVSQTGTDVDVNGAGATLECFGFQVSLAENHNIGTTGTACPSLVSAIDDDGAHSVNQVGATVIVNGVGVAWGCLGVGVVIPEIFYLP